MAASRDYLLVVLVVMGLTASATQAKTEGKNQDSRVEDVSRIIGGNITPIEKFPWQVYLSTQFRNVSGAGVCGGSIISKTWILTAWHCLFTKGAAGLPKRIDVLAGMTKTSCHAGPDVQHSILYENEFEDHLFLHPKFYNKAPLNNDIALIKLKKPLTFNEKVKPIALANQNDFIPGKELIASGWGRVIDDGPPANILHYVDGLQLMSRDYCKTLWSQLNRTVTNKMICHFSEGRNMCHGDSGGAVITGRGSSNGPPYVQIGINSWLAGDGLCEEVTSAVLTDVAKFRNWINKTISKQCKIGSKRCSKLARKGRCNQKNVLKTCKKMCTECGFPN